MTNSIIYLVAQTVSIDDAGDRVLTDGADKKVFCSVYSANEKEKMYAESRGEIAEMCFVVPDKRMYAGEICVKYNGEKFKVVDVKWSDNDKMVRLVVRRWERQ